MARILGAANVQRNGNDAAHVGFHGKRVEVVVILIVPPGLRYDDPLNEGMQEAACEENPGIVLVFLAGGRRRHERELLEAVFASTHGPIGPGASAGTFGFEPRFVDRSTKCFSARR